MQSQFVVALRALIMLGALVALPTFALRDVKVPDRVWELLDLVRERVAVLAQNSSASAPPQRELPPLEFPLRQPVSEIESGRPIATPLATHYETPPWTATSAMTDVEPWPATNVSHLKTSHETPAPIAAPHQAASPPSGATHPLAEEGNPFEAIHQRLRTLGATSFVLESWGASNELFRFQSDVAVHDDPNFHRHFQAIHADALMAMRDVLEQVEAWRGRQYR